MKYQSAHRLGIRTNYREVNGQRQGSLNPASLEGAALAAPSTRALVTMVSESFPLWVTAFPF
jgi:hypothetical protein